VPSDSSDPLRSNAAGKPIRLVTELQATPRSWAQTSNFVHQDASVRLILVLAFRRRDNRAALNAGPIHLQLFGNKRIYIILYVVFLRLFFSVVSFKGNG
jgi:hypothetical protein